ncbi:MAG: crossover junction endodeoxyribonuclease RuvC [Candidatus Sericytochromatia bacterium]|nr:crossover junction endodeoxyribonuclease RuvC [Candidatus Sericytochromatia bacterium]
MKIFGIDPGTATTGYGMIVIPAHGPAQAVTYGVIRTESKTPMAERLHTIHADLTELLTAMQPDCVAIEQLFFFQNITSGMQVAQARGVALLAVAQHGMPAAEYTPMQIKQSLTGFGKAPKAEVQRQVAEQLGLSEIPRPDDAADALAIALTHALFFAAGNPRMIR